MPVINNKHGHTALIRATGNATIVVAGNTSVSNIAHPSESADVVGAAITKIVWTTDARVDVKRGANTVIVIPAGSTDQFDLRDLNMVLSEYAAANLVITTAAAANCTLLIELTKTFT